MCPHNAIIWPLWLERCNDLASGFTVCPLSVVHTYPPPYPPKSIPWLGNSSALKYHMWVFPLGQKEELCGKAGITSVQRGDAHNLCHLPMCLTLATSPGNPTATSGLINSPKCIPWLGNSSALKYYFLSCSQSQCIVRQFVQHPASTA